MEEKEVFGDYLKRKRLEKNMGTNQLALSSGVSAPQISRIENGSRGVPKNETLVKLANALNIPKQEMFWAAGFFYFEFPVFEIEDLENTLRRLAGGTLFNIESFTQQLSDLIKEETEYLRRTQGVEFNFTPKDIIQVCREVNNSDFTTALVQDLMKVEAKINSVNSTDEFETINLPVVSKISYGNGQLTYEEIERYEATPRSWISGAEYFYLRAKGDSMVNARINEGDLLLIRKQEEVEEGEIAAVMIGDEAVLKRVYRQGNTLILQSENPKYAPIICEAGGENTARIIGKLKMVTIIF